jgi:peptidoglycan hydrolase-like amidase
MDQHAAAAKANSGMDAEEILRFYYPRASLRQLNSSISN